MALLTVHTSLIGTVNISSSICVIRNQKQTLRLVTNRVQNTNISFTIPVVRNQKQTLRLVTNNISFGASNVSMSPQMYWA